MKLDIGILYEDEDLLVIDKPSLLIVNRADTTEGQNTVQEWVEAKFKGQRSKVKIDEDSDFYKRAGIAHRIDKETSGILVIAKTLSVFENLQAQFKERKVEKTYIALVHGKVEPASGEINVPVGRLPWNRMRFGVIAGGRESLTKYKTISNFKFPISNEQLTLLELYPKTGRTHQIRVHLKHINHSIFSDPLYAGRKTSRNDRKVLSRIFLHASKISFFHPKTNVKISFESSLPKELADFLATLETTR